MGARKKATAKKSKKAGTARKLPSKKKPPRRKKTKAKRKRGKRGPDKTPRKRRTDGPKPPPSNGRPPGTPNGATPKGIVGALKSCRYRVPEGTAPELGELADLALEIVAKVMVGAIRVRTGPRLAAAKTIREEVCGQVPKHHEHAGSVVFEVVSGIPRNPDDPIPPEVAAELDQPYRKPGDE